MSLNPSRQPQLSIRIFSALLWVLLAAPTALGQERASSAPPQLIWSAQTSGTLARLSSVFFTDREHGWIVGSNSTVLVTGDGGNTWRRVPLPHHELLRDVFFLDPQRGFALGEYSIFNRLDNLSPKERAFLLASDDGGANWRAVSLAPQAVKADDPKRYNGDGLLRLLFVDDRAGWACGEAGLILVTRDGGRMWQLQRSPVTKLFYDLAAIDDKQAWIVGGGGAVLRTVDGGQQWNEQSSGTSQALRAVHFVDGRRGWAVGAGGTILATNNGGNRWRAQTSGTEENLNAVVFTSATEGWAAGDHATLLHTRDGGTTWEQVTLKTRVNLARLFFIAPDCGWVVGGNGAIFKYQPGDPTRPALSNQPSDE